MEADFLTPLLTNDPAASGGKATGLKLAARAGARVPPTAFFDLEKIAHWLSRLAGHDEAVRAWSRWSGDARAVPEKLVIFRASLLAAPEPARLVPDCARIRELLGDGRLIVRSSMSGEDAVATSFAGAFRSVEVHIPTNAALWAAIKQVLASAFEPAAALQVLAAGVAPENFRPGFVIQRLVDARAAGVCFSRCPEKIWSAGGVVEWAAGSGEGVVQGSAATETVAQTDGPRAGSQLVAFWSELWETAFRLERALGAPADLEWAWDGTTLWIVQARVIASEEARAVALTPEGTRWTRALSLERFPEAITPIGWTAIADSMESNLDSLRREFGVVVNRSRAMAVRLHARVYSDPDFFSFPSRVKLHWWRYLAPWRAHLPCALVALARYLLGRLSSPSVRASKALLKLDLVGALMGPQARSWRARWAAHVAAGMREVDAFKAKWRALDAEKPGERELLARMEELRAISLRFLEPDFTVFLVKDTLHKALEGLWGSLKLAPLGFADLVGSLDGNRTIEMSREWVELVAALRGEPRRDEFLARLATKDARDLLGTEARTLWERFLERNGHNRTSWDIAVPCWSDAPEQLAPLLAASIAGASAARGTKDRQIAAAQKLRTALGEAGLGDATGRVESAVALLRDFMRMDEELHFLTGHLLEPSRKLVLAAGSWLAGEGLLARADDAFFMELGELKGALRAPRATLRFLAERRRAEFERACKSEPPFEYPVDELPLSVDSRPRLASDRSLLGKAMSGGVGEGIVVIAEHLGGVGKLERGSVLVTTAPNPAFVPLYPLLGGIVSATGGMLSHGFVAAREFGLPAVSGIADATTRLKVGTRVRVDGERGVVEIL